MQDESTHAFINEDKGWLEIVLGKMITKDDYLNLIKSVYELEMVLQDRGKPVMLLVDCSRQEQMEEMAEELAVKGTRDLNFKKIASYQLNPKYIPLLGKILGEIKTEGAEIQNFNTREEAETWLQA